MGFTLGLPPGIYLEQTPEVLDLVEKITPLNGMICPSYYIDEPKIDNNNKTVVISQIPSKLTQEILILELNNLIRARFQFGSKSNYISSCNISSANSIAYITTTSQEIAEFLVSLRSITIGNETLPIAFPSFLLEDLPPLDKASQSQLEPYLYIVIEPAEGSALPSDERIKAFFEKTAHVLDIFQPQNYSYKILHFQNIHDVDIIMINYSNCNIDGIQIVLHRSSRDPLESETFIDPIIKDQIRQEQGKSQYYSVLSPYMQNNPISIADIFDLSMPLNALIRKETEELRPALGNYLLIFNVAPQKAYEDEVIKNQIYNDFTQECLKYGKFLSCELGFLFPDKTVSDQIVICVSYLTNEDAKAAQSGIAGRRYCGQILITQLVAQKPRIYF